jgi:hypothetical protein
MDCVKLYFKQSLIGVLTYNSNDQVYMFIKNKFFTNDYIKNVMGINDDKEIYYSKNLFSFFLSFVKRYGANEVGDEYQKLLKITEYDFDKNQFRIGA